MVLSAKVPRKEKVVNLPATAKKVKKGTRRKFRLNGPAVILLLVLGFVFYTFGGQMVELYNVRHEVKKIRGQIEEMEKKNDELNKQVQFLQSDAYVERMAREKLSLVKPGEKIILEAKPGVIPYNTRKKPAGRVKTEVH